MNPVEFPAPSAPYAVAQQLHRDYLTDEGMSKLAAWRGGWMVWRTTHWAEVSMADLRQIIYGALNNAVYWHVTKSGAELKDWSPDRHKVTNVLEALAAVVHLRSDIDPPAWVNTHHGSGRSAIATAPADGQPEDDAAQMISCRNGLLDLSTRTLWDHTPALFNLITVPLDYDPRQGQPTEWLRFLASVWDDDEASILLLQEYFGYVLSGRLDMQKALLLVGPIRSGKGTIERVLTALMGGNIASPTLAGLNTNFGLSPLIGKPLAFVTDARLGNTPSHVVVERLLSITGEDWLTIDRKYREPWTGKLPTRFVILSNELPKFRDSSGAIATRLLILQMTESFYGREDHELDAKLHEELGPILLWALAGLDRLTRTGRFTEPETSRDAAALMMDLASPVSAFVRERCVRTPEAWVTRDDLYAAWCEWAESNGHQRTAKSTFGRDLRSVVPGVKDSHLRWGNKRVWCYAHIGLLPVPPVPPDEAAGEGLVSGTGHAVPPRKFGDYAEPGTEPPVPPGHGKPQAGGGGTGGTGRNPIVGFTAPSGPGRCSECGWHINTQGHQPGCPANTEGEQES
jgi:putative DNA primase/helicase